MQCLQRLPLFPSLQFIGEGLRFSDVRTICCLPSLPRQDPFLCLLGELPKFSSIFIFSFSIPVSLQSPHLTSLVALLNSKPLQPVSVTFHHTSTGMPASNRPTSDARLAAVSVQQGPELIYGVTGNSKCSVCSTGWHRPEWLFKEQS